MGTPNLKCFPHLVSSLITGVLQGQVHHSVLKRPSHVEFQRQVVDPLPRDREEGSGPPIDIQPGTAASEPLSLLLSYLPRPSMTHLCHQFLSPCSEEPLRFGGPVDKKGTGPYMPLKCLFIWPRFPLPDKEAAEAYLRD